MSKELQEMIDAFLCGKKPVIVDDENKIPDMKGKKIVFALELNEIGIDDFILKVILKLREKDEKALAGSTGAILVHSSSELYTKSAISHVIFISNLMGCSFMGHPAVEAVKGYKNLMTWKKVYPDETLSQISIRLSRSAGERFFNRRLSKIENPKITVLHASSRKTSNTLMLWNKVENELLKSNCEVKQVHVENEDMRDCRGCTFKMCKHYGEQTSCFYGGLVVEEVFPAVENCDCLVFICPNYNDSISANLMAVVNRLTALYRKMTFYDKTFFAVIVSGNSGSDSVARQLIGALNANKGFRLAPRFAIMELANDPGSIQAVEGIDDRAKQFARHMLSEIKRNNYRKK